MASAAERALAEGRHLAVEAGTGVGKSFAYLVPAIELARRRKCRVLVSTYTIALQEQLINKDIPFLAKCLPHSFTAVLAKGRGNYLCKRRLEFALRKQKGLFDQVFSELERLKSWADTTSDGSLSDLPSPPPRSRANTEIAGAANAPISPGVSTGERDGDWKTPIVSSRTMLCCSATLC